MSCENEQNNIWLISSTFERWLSEIFWVIRITCNRGHVNFIVPSCTIILHLGYKRLRDRSPAAASSVILFRDYLFLSRRRIIVAIVWISLSQRQEELHIVHFVAIFCIRPDMQSRGRVRQSWKSDRGIKSSDRVHDESAIADKSVEKYRTCFSSASNTSVTLP